MSTVLNVVLILGAALIAVNSLDIVWRVFQFWVFNREEEWEEEEEHPKVLQAMFGVVSVNLIISLSYITILSLLTKLPDLGGVDYLQKLGGVNYIGVLFVAALVEEALFRWIPLTFGWVVKDAIKKDWYRSLGIISSLVFGLVHITNYPNPDPSYLLLVVPQIVGGLMFYWFALKYKHGWAFVVYAHFMFNLIPSMSSILGWK